MKESTPQESWVFKSNSPEQTRSFSTRFAKAVLRCGPGKKAAVIALQGELGSGKTTFLQGFARGLGIKEKVLSPSFVIMKKLKIPSYRPHASRFRFRDFYHFDCYRIDNQKELLALGLREIITRPQNIVVVEWADRVHGAIPRDSTWIRFHLRGKSEREIRIQGPR